MNRETINKCNPFMQANKTLLKIFKEKPLKRITLPKGGVLMPDDNQSLIGYIEEGMLKITIVSEEGKERLLWVLGDNSLVVFFQNRIYKETVALKETKIIMMDKNTFIESMLTDRSYFDLFLEQLYSKMQYCTDTLLMQDKNTSKIKIYTLLQQLGKSYGVVRADQSIFIKNFLTRTDMASITGVHRSNIIRYIGELEKMDIIKKEKKDIIIKQPQMLEQLIQTAQDNLAADEYSNA
ncbi:MAG: transcriptional regulator, Crp/Fnr family [Firmicutes bacterium]|nr:transcriptional regulator, Crp/Fnr family [Bacillota bacterium]